MKNKYQNLKRQIQHDIKGNLQRMNHAKVFKNIQNPQNVLLTSDFNQHTSLLNNNKKKI